MTPEEYISLYEKYIAGLCTAQEKEALLQYRDAFHIQDDNDARLSDTEKQLRSRIYQRIAATTVTTPAARPKVIRLAHWWYAAAALLLAVGLAALFFKQAPPKLIAKTYIKKKDHQPIKPGTNTAILTLANGRTVLLDKTANGLVDSSGNTTIKKLRNGQLAYASTGTNADADPDAENTISIPRGGQYAVTLPDGTNVWLNSESSLTYPVAFTGKQRRVVLTGEAYFEVAKNKNMPFVVHTNQADVNVLGTHFNVNAYEGDDEVKTTLLEGSVRLSGKSSSAMLVPGEQGLVAGNEISKRQVNINQVIAWKLGYFVFRKDNIKDIMKQVSRWYDVEVEFRGNMTGKTFGGTYSKNKDINELLKGLELTGIIHFKIEGRRIIVMT
ncbi:hypothetical protein GCM10023149_23140 [Mucilaginibacter gynuensis]|uniref:FecR family protein n=1 Tax=Mucilaginibacter gynuensis TaxID=1302236 RepID=A0ABP8GE95_9SPHI